MRNLRRNCQKVYFKVYTGVEREIIDNDGNRTGTFEKVYGSLQSAELCVSPDRGSVDLSPFGTTEGYDRVMTTADTNCKIDEKSIIWLKRPQIGDVHDYVVARRAPWKNSIAYAIQKVNVSG